MAIQKGHKNKTHIYAKIKDLILKIPYAGLSVQKYLKFHTKS